MLRLKTNLRFFIAYLIFAFLCIFTIASLSSDLIKNVLIEDRSNVLYREGSVLASRYGVPVLNDAVDASTAARDLEPFATYLSASIWILDTNGNVVLSTGSSYAGSAPSSVESFDPAFYSAPSISIGRFYDLFQNDVLTTSSPITSGVRTLGYVLIHQPVKTIMALRDKLLRTVYITFTVIFVFSFIIFAVFVFFVQRPMRAIIRAAQEYAEGNLGYEIELDRSDEIGYLAASLNDMSGKLNAIEETQRKFIANVSHDFRSPLTSIKGYTEAIADGTIPPDQIEKYLGIIVFETERLTDLTEDLLTLSDFDMNGMAIAAEEYDINESIKRTAASFEGTCIKKRIRIELLFAERVTVVRADRGKIQQVLYNLLDNAIKFSPEDSEITVETTIQGNKVRVSVKDTGIGIPKESLGKIWDRFYKSDASRGQDKKGTGLGLSIVKDIINAHGETINVVSTEGVGSEFVFTLPLV